MELFSIRIRRTFQLVSTSFLETGVDLESKIDDNIIYYLDTQIVLEALDLQKAEDTLPTQELLKLISF